MASIYTWETITVTGRHGTEEEEKGLSSGRIVQLQGPTIWNLHIYILPECRKEVSGPPPERGP